MLVRVYYCTPCGSTDPFSPFHVRLWGGLVGSTCAVWVVGFAIPGGRCVLVGVLYPLEIDILIDRAPCGLFWSISVLTWGPFTSLVRVTIPVRPRGALSSVKGCIPMLFFAFCTFRSVRRVLSCTFGDRRIPFPYGRSPMRRMVGDARSFLSPGSPGSGGRFAGGLKLRTCWRRDLFHCDLAEVGVHRAFVYLSFGPLNNSALY